MYRVLVVIWSNLHFPIRLDLLWIELLHRFQLDLSQVQIEGPTFSGREMENDWMSFNNFLFRFENCAAGMANDAEKLIFLKCYLSERLLLLINHLCQYKLSAGTLSVKEGIYRCQWYHWQDISTCHWFLPQRGMFLCGSWGFHQQDCFYLGGSGQLNWLRLFWGWFSGGSINGQNSFLEISERVEGLADSIIWN